MNYAPASEIAAVDDDDAGAAIEDQRRPLRDVLSRHGQFGPGQTAGRFYPTACVALEVTQRCNLDCTLCYLSDKAEMAHDVPLPVLFRRLDIVERHYGRGVSVQITGGDATLRTVEDLQALCREIRKRGMRSCLMTNGIKASRDLLARLAEAGLDDVAFHVDLTQERKGYATEVSLNPLREEYIRRADGLGIRVLFNTTIFAGNVEELPVLARFFRSQAAHVTLASFQLQAAAGRGLLRGRPDNISLERVEAALSAGVETPLDFGAAAVGHENCNRYASMLVAGDNAASLLDNRKLVADVFEALEQVERRRDGYIDIARSGLRVAIRRPLLAFRTAGYILNRLWRIRGGLGRSRLRAHRLAFLIHNFMDSRELDCDRCECCVFMVIAENGPVSMCEHNAQRDQYVFEPARAMTPAGPKYWSAATGEWSDTPEQADVGEMPFKRLKGRLRSQAHAVRRPKANRDGA